MKAINQNGLSLQYASNKLKADREIILKAIKHTYAAVHFASNELPDVETILLLSIKRGLYISNGYYFGKSASYWKNNLSNIYNKSFDELETILRSSKLTLTDAGAKVFTINKEFNENTISMISMAGCVYTINNIDREITFNRLADELYKLDNSHNNIAFINDKGNTFDLGNFNENVIDSI